MKNKIKKKYKIFLIIYSAFFTLSIISVSLSKYSSSFITHGSQKIAKWDVSLNTLDNLTNNYDIVVGNSVSYTLKVISNSEVAVSYSIIISKLPNDILVSFDGENYISPINNSISYENVGSFFADDINNVHEHIIIFKTTADTQAALNKEIDLDVVFVQQGP